MKDEVPVVYVIDDDQSLRESLKWLIESVGLKVLEHDSAESFLREFDDDSPGCIVVDVRMPGVTGLELQLKLNELDIMKPIIVISGQADVPMAVKAIRNGAVDFIQKPFSYQVLLERIEEAIDMDKNRRSQQVKQNEYRSLFDLLTDREREVMQLVVDGNANKQIAAKLGLSQKTIELHRSHVMKKLKVRNVPELVRIAMALEPYCSKN